MRDYQDVIVKFVKIVERYPELYDSTLDAYRTRHAELAWDKIADAVKTELGEECTVEEIKSKWKGIRSSYNRCKNKLYNSKSDTTSKKYYLYDSLKFLEPFTKPKGLSSNLQEINFEECGNSGDDDSIRDGFGNEMDNWEITVKSEARDEENDVLNTNTEFNIDSEEINDTNVNQSPELIYNKPKKRKCEDAVGSGLNDSEDLNFFKSILPDIIGFSVKEKRKLKIGILKMIDEIEDSRTIERVPCNITLIN